MKKSILVMTYGSPESYDFNGICEFFTNIRKGKRPNDDEINLLLGNYLKIKQSPLQEITKKEVELLRDELGEEYSIYFANKFSRPFIPDVIKTMENDGIEQCICLVLEPHYSIYSIMGYERFIKSDKIKFNIIKSWYKEEELINYWVDEIKKIIENDIKTDSYKAIFTAHSVPEIAFKFNDPYVEQVYNMTDIIANKLDLHPDNYVNTWQSESDIGMPWIKPDVLEYLRAQEKHPEHYIFIPLSFISEHVEVLYDNDVECKELCEKFDVRYHRPPMPNYDPRLIKALVSTIRKHENNKYTFHNPEKSTFDEFKESEPKMPEFVKEMLAKREANNTGSNQGNSQEMPDFVKAMLGINKNN